eukprot:TRINITY_DN2807_c0_g1_i5.p1 TRINITY_DN2807_c0_g1~~TRINITY_DN2807_c0_g1_i5.p1  ORF type:complete len:663 (+),score=122.81 TRINITY_DN2807_c0_g1_i5:38-1990(+)
MATKFRAKVSGVKAKTVSQPLMQQDLYVKCNWDNVKVFQTELKKCVPNVALEWSFETSFEYEASLQELARKTFRLDLYTGGFLGNDALVAGCMLDLNSIATGPVRNSIPLRRGGATAGPVECTLEFDVQCDALSCVSISFADVSVKNKTFDPTTFEPYLEFFYSNCLENAPRTPVSLAAVWTAQAFQPALSVVASLRELLSECVIFKIRNAKQGPDFGFASISFRKYITAYSPSLTGKFAEPVNLVQPADSCSVQTSQSSSPPCFLEGVITIYNLPATAQMPYGFYNGTSVIGGTSLIPGLPCTQLQPPPQPQPQPQPAQLQQQPQAQPQLQYSQPAPARSQCAPPPPLLPQYQAQSQYSPLPSQSAITTSYPPIQNQNQYPPPAQSQYTLQPPVATQPQNQYAPPLPAQSQYQAPLQSQYSLPPNQSQYEAPLAQSQPPQYPSPAQQYPHLPQNLPAAPYPPAVPPLSNASPSSAYSPYSPYRQVVPPSSLYPSVAQLPQPQPLQPKPRPKWDDALTRLAQSAHHNSGAPPQQQGPPSGWSRLVNAYNSAYGTNLGSNLAATIANLPPAGPQTGGYPPAPPASASMMGTTPSIYNLPPLYTSPPGVQPAPALAPVQQQMPVGWTQSKDEYGRVFYVDHINKTTHWELPV